jgi:hypothetical protein
VVVTDPDNLSTGLTATISTVSATPSVPRPASAALLVSAILANGCNEWCKQVFHQCGNYRAERRAHDDGDCKIEEINCFNLGTFCLPSQPRLVLILGRLSVVIISSLFILTEAK